MYQGREMKVSKRIERGGELNVKLLGYTRDFSGVHALANALKFNAVLNKIVLSSNKIKDEGAIALGEALKTNTTLKELELLNCEIGVAGGKSLAAALSEGSAMLTSLNLQNNGLGPEGAKALADALRVNAVLKSINLRYNSLDTEGWCAIFHALRDNKDNKIESWHLKDQGIGADTAKALAEYVSVSAVLTSLDVGSNRRLNEAAALAIVRAARQHDKMAILSLEFCEIGPSMAKEIAEYVRGSAVLSFINIFGIAIGDEGMRAIGTAILSSSTSKLGALKCDAFDLGPNVASLDLSRKDISSAVVTLLAGVIKFNAVLTSINLSSSNLAGETNYIKAREVQGESKEVGAKVIYQGRVMTVSTGVDSDGDLKLTDFSGVLALSEALKVNAVLTECNVRGNKLDSESAHALAKVATEKGIMIFGTKHDQKEASFVNQGLGPVDAILIASDLRVSAVLTTLDLSGNRLEAEGAKALARALSVNRVLTKLDVQYNRGLGDEGKKALQDAAKRKGREGFELLI